MFDIDNWSEIFESIKQNKLRTFLTGFSVGWGMFMLIILLGAGSGLQNKVEQDFSDNSNFYVRIWPGTTSMGYKGLQPGRDIQLKNNDLPIIQSELYEEEKIASQRQVWGVSMKTEGYESSYQLRGVSEEAEYFKPLDIQEGRTLNKNDIENAGKVLVIGRLVKEEMFKDKDPINQYISVGGVFFKVVGWFTASGGRWEESSCYAPITTCQKIFGGNDYLSQITFSTESYTEDGGEQISSDVKNSLARKHLFNPDDPRAIFLYNNHEEYMMTQNIFGGINLFIWIIGGMTIVAGMVGISNIMLIVVKDRTKEIGVRKAIGARPINIILMILFESIVITFIAGYLGLVSGVFLIEYVGDLLGQMEDAPFVAPTIKLNVVFTALGILVLSGAVAGLIPALKAATIKPIEALRAE